MATKIYLGYPPQHVIDWIKKHTQPATRAETRIWWSSDESNYNDYLIEGALDCPALIEKGLMPEGSGTEMAPYWNTNPYSVEIGTDVTSIGDYAFYVCNNMTSVTIPDSVMSIGEYAFYDCHGLTIVTIPSSVTNIRNSAFNGCSYLTNLTFLGKTMEQVQNIEDGNGNKYYPWGISNTSIINVA